MSEQPPSTDGKTASNGVKAAGTTTGTSADALPKKALPEQNPALKMMGLPRFRLPSRNWMIFLSITGSFTSAIMYDRWQTRKNKEKWCKLVSHIAEESIGAHTLSRKLTIYLSAPPGDGLRSAREHFINYVKPILVAAAIDWDVIEGRKEGDVRYKTAEHIRQRRRMAGEGEPLSDEDNMIAILRKSNGSETYPGVAGDLVLGRHTWKEYVRGLHEGWLGPTSAPLVEEPDATNVATPAVHSTEAAAETTTTEINAESDENSTADSDAENAKKVEEKKEEEKPKPRFPPAYITPEHYSEASPSRILPEVFDPVAPISCPHVLGFRNTPIRLYRYLTRRRLADDIGRQVASAILSQYRGYGVVAASADDSPSGDSNLPEQEQVLKREERDWWKTVRQPRKEFEESVLIEPMYFDHRISSRMRQFELSSEDEDRARQIAAGDDKQH